LIWLISLQHALEPAAAGLFEERNEKQPAKHNSGARERKEKLRDISAHRECV